MRELRLIYDKEQLGMGTVGSEESARSYSTESFLFSRKKSSPLGGPTFVAVEYICTTRSLFINKVLHLSQLFRTSLSLAISIQVSVIYLPVTKAVA